MPISGIRAVNFLGFIILSNIHLCKWQQFSTKFLTAVVAYYFILKVWQVVTNSIFVNMKYSFLGSIFLLLFSISNAQPASPTSAEIFAQIKKLNMLGSVLYIAAHPDDENNTLLPYLAKEKLYRTAYLSITRGDGGQNLIGSEQGVELGLIRTQELLAARRIDGSEQYFTRAYEFGYSKSAEESLKFWDKEKILADVVWVIRQYQPDIIINRFPPDARGGHGHHTASAILADEAFIAAADPKRFPEQFNYGVKPWQAKRLLWNGFNFGGVNTTNEPDALKIDAGIYNPLLGKSYGEIGGEARSMHKSQGEGRPRRRGEVIESFTTTGGPVAKTDLMEGITTDWSRIDGAGNIQAAISEVINTFNFFQPELSVPALIKIYQSIKKLNAENWRDKKLTELQNIIEACAGLFSEAVTQQEYAVQGDTLKLVFNFNNRSNLNALVKNITVVTSTQIMQEKLATVKRDSNTTTVIYLGETRKPEIDSAVQLQLLNNKNVVVNHILKLNDYAPRSEPYWLASSMRQGYFDVINQYLIGQAESLPAYNARFTINLEGQDFLVDRPVQYKVTDQVRGEVYQPLIIIPKVNVAVSPTLVLSNVKSSVNGKVTTYSPTLTLNYKSNIDATNVPLSVIMQNGFATDVVKNKMVNLQKGATYSIPVKVKDVYYEGARKYIDPVVSLKLDGREVNFTQNFKTIRYDHIPTLHYFYRDNLKVVDDEIKIVGKKVGYINGAGDKVADAVTALGFDMTILNEQDLTLQNLEKFDAIIIGVRAHNIYEYLTTKNEVLNQYVFSGGNLIVQYIRSNAVGNKRIKVGPYPFTVSNQRVAEEDAAVKFLLPNHSALNYPNKITAKDFDGWVQERSTYQMDQSGAEFERLLAMNDTGEKESNGSLAIAKYGKGNVSYVSLVLFRQLPAGISGAYRLLANLIALPQNK